MYENLKYCVYIHRRKTDNSIFYIGSGREYRAQSPSGRTSIWKNEADTHGFIVEILESDLSKAESLERELHYYDSLKTARIWLILNLLHLLNLLIKSFCLNMFIMTRLVRHF